MAGKIKCLVLLIYFSLTPYTYIMYSEWYHYFSTRWSWPCPLFLRAIEISAVALKKVVSCNRASTSCDYFGRIFFSRYAHSTLSYARTRVSQYFVWRTHTRNTGALCVSTGVKSNERLMHLCDRRATPNIFHETCNSGYGDISHCYSGSTLFLAPFTSCKSLDL